MTELTHFNPDGRARMVDVSDKPATARTAIAAGSVLLNIETFARVRDGQIAKGDVLAVAQVAGIMAAKRTSDLIPMCHPVALTGLDLSFRLDESCWAVEIQASARCTGETGVEMEALMAVSAAALTIYDMCKAIQRDITIQNIRLLAKTGGQHGDYYRED